MKYVKSNRRTLRYLRRTMRKAAEYTITKKAYEELSAFRDEVYAGGVDSLPPDLKPDGGRRLITLGVLVEMSVRAARKRFQRNG